jgi:hypothetical protein
MPEPLEVEAGERSIEELLAALDEGRRITVQTEFLGGEHEITLRREGDVYYCDTPTRLHRHESVEEMRTCIRKQGYASDG